MKILIIRLSSMGDIIHTLPAITDASQNITNAEFHWVVEKGFSSIPRWHNAVHKVFPVELRKYKGKLISGLKYYKELIKVLREEKYDLIIDSQGLIKSMLIGIFCNGKVSGYSKHSAKEPIASLGYKYKHNIPHNQHAIFKNRALFAKSLGYEIDNCSSTIDYGITYEFNKKSNNDNYIVFLHGTTWNSKCWPLQKWLELAKIASNNGVRVEVTYATPKQQQRAFKLAKMSSNVTVRKHMGIDEAATWIQGSTAVVSVDTGFGHLAAAFEKPIVGIFGPTKIQLTGILGSESKVHLFSSPRYCAPCLQKKCPMLTYQDKGITSLCMDDYSAEDVWSALQSKISSTNKRHSALAL
jgi:heptosyltransferase-1